jgi:arabinose-5-phosphate isomerase
MKKNKLIFREYLVSFFNSQLSSIRNFIELDDPNLESNIMLLSACFGKYVFTGVGKSGLIARKLSATFSSLGLPSIFIHPTEAVHGDMGVIDDTDQLIAFSNSGNTKEITFLIEAIKNAGLKTKIVGFSSSLTSTLASTSDAFFHVPYDGEASFIEFVPTTSSTITLIYVDGIANILSILKGFTKEAFSKIHPSGIIGIKLNFKVKDLMIKIDRSFIIEENSPLKDAIKALVKNGSGAVMISDSNFSLKGLITDGDLKRILDNSQVQNITMVPVKNVMTINPIFINEYSSVSDAVLLMENRSKQISILPVLDSNNKISGLIRLHDIVRRGII